MTSEIEQLIAKLYSEISELENDLHDSECKLCALASDANFQLTSDGGKFEPIAL